MPKNTNNRDIDVQDELYRVQSLIAAARGAISNSYPKGTHEQDRMEINGIDIALSDAITRIETVKGWYRNEGGED